MAGLYNAATDIGTASGEASGGVVADDISALTQPQNSFQQWQNPGGGLAGMGKRPDITDYLTPNQVRHQITGMIGAPPNTDIRSAADRPGGGGLGGGISLGGGFDSEKDWRSVFGPKKTPSQVAPGIGMMSVIASQQHAANLLHSLTGGS